MLIERKHRFFPEETRDPPINEDDESMQAHDLCRDGGPNLPLHTFLHFCSLLSHNNTKERRPLEEEEGWRQRQEKRLLDFTPFL
jgi:hypothetical protein